MILHNLQQKKKKKHTHTKKIYIYISPKSKDSEKFSRKILIHVPTLAKRNGTCTQTSKYGNVSKNARLLRQWTAKKTTFLKWIHSIALTTILKIIFRRKFKKVLENIRKDIPVTSHRSSYKNSTYDNASDCDNPGL